MKKKILIVDDIFDNIKVVMNYLHDLPYILYFATDGKQALQSIIIVEPDLILMDVMMPYLDGYETVIQIKKEKKYSDIPVIFLTAKNEPEDIARGFEVGCVDYLSKPINKLELIARVKTHLDLTEYRHELEKKVIEEKEEIDFLKLAQKQLVESEKMASLGSLVAGVAHEINTPLGVGITGISHFHDITKHINELYNNDNMSMEEFENYLSTSLELSDSIQLNLLRAAELIRSFKRIAVDQSSDERREFNLKENMEGLLLSLGSIIKKTNHKININCDEDINLFTYPGAFTQILTNLIMNSFIHAFNENDTGLIDINFEEKNNQVIMNYKDNGKGIKKEIIGKIFDPFFTTSRAHGGSGLGLNIVYNIIKSTFRGDISCTSQENEGTKFILTFNL